jgi:TPP-dependent pyruvate/acetoin dehydrogenase alpha subunit
VSRVEESSRSVEWLESMIRIRAFEDACHRLFAAGVVRGSTHLAQGQEAVVVGACAALQSGDTMTCTYRGHGAVLAMGASVEASFGEILGKAGGLCGGLGGSMHLTDVSVGALGSFGIVGAHLPIANGAALASSMRGDGAVSVCFFGDGSTNIGAFHESLNLASIWKLPVIFVCENNLYGEYSPLATTTPVGNIAGRADSYAMPRETLDGNRVSVVRDGVLRAVERGREGGGPTLIEAMTYRHKGHSRSDPASYRPEGELEEWLKRDPIVLLEAELEGEGIGPEELASARSRAEGVVAEALERAQQSPDPAPDAAEGLVWS